MPLRLFPAPRVPTPSPTVTTLAWRGAAAAVAGTFLLAVGPGGTLWAQENPGAEAPGAAAPSPVATPREALESTPDLAPEPGQALSYRIPHMALALELLPDGDMVVHETMRFQVEAGEFGEGYRRIPLPRGVTLRDIGVTSPDLELDSLAVRPSRSGTEITWHFPRRSASATFTLRYRVEGALLSRNGENIIDWDAVGTDWAVPLEEVQVVVQWPGLGLHEETIQVEPPGDARLARGEGTTGTGALDPPEGGEAPWIATFTPGSLPAGTSYRVRVSFPERIEGRLPPEPFDVPRGLLLGLLALVAGAAPGAVLIRSGSHPRPVPPGTPARDPGSEEAMAAIGVPEVGFITQGALTWMQRVFPATLVSLARRGHLVLEPGEPEGGGGNGDPAQGGEGGSMANLRIRRTDPGQGAGPLAPAEGAFLDALEAEGSWNGFLAGASRFQREALKEVARAMEEGGFLVQERGRSVVRLVLGTVLLALSPLALILLSRSPGAGPELTLGFFIFLLAAGFGMLAAGSRAFDLTDGGDRVRREHRARMTALRSRFSQALDNDPEEARGILMEELEWFLLDPRHGTDWFRGVERRLEAAGIPLDLPGWLVPGSGVGGEDGETLASLLPLYLVLFPSAQGSPGGIPGSGTPSVGVGGSGGFGGGGGGIR